MYDDEQRREDQRREAQRDEDRRTEQRRVEIHQEEMHRRRLLCFSCGLFMATVAGRCTGCVEAEQDTGQPGDREAAGPEEYRPDERRREAVERLTENDREMLWHQACQDAETYEQARDRFWEMLTGQGSTGPATGAVRSEDLSTAQMRAYSQNFDTTPQLNDLWERACQREDGRRRSYDDARGAFWQLVNEGQDADSRWVRAMLEMAQFELGAGTAAHLLRLVTGARSDTRDDADRRLTIDHATAQAHDASLATASMNLRLMTGRDNSFRGNRYNAEDENIKQAAARARA